MALSYRSSTSDFHSEKSGAVPGWATFIIYNPTITVLSNDYIKEKYQRKAVSSGFGWALPNGPRTACIRDW